MGSACQQLKRRLVLLAYFLVSAAYAQVIPVNPTYQGLFASSDPTLTFLFRAENAKATLVFIPGGEGRAGIKPEWTADHGYFSKYYFNLMLRSLTDPKLTSGSFNLVIFDSPVDLPTANHWSVARTSAEHLSRVEDVVRHFREMLGKPVWVMGHSMGSISITELYKRLQEKKAESLVAGLVFSGGENGASFNYESTRLPVLVVHHENDECPGNTAESAKKLHAKLRAAGNTAAELVLITTGTRTPNNSNGCRSGYHMYFGAGADVARALDQYMVRHLPGQ
jgi:pimeloyl-ACP methyl ester carboxylesterase